MKPMPKPTNSKKDLAQFVDRTLKKSFEAFKTEWEEGQAFKKRSVIQLINALQWVDKRKCMDRWKWYHRKNKTYELMQISSHIFSNINFAIKSVADNAFLNSKENEVKEKALIQLFKNLQGNLGETFRRWR
jgi:hypothetical protein